MDYALFVHCSTNVKLRRSLLAIWPFRFASECKFDEKKIIFIPDSI